MLRRLSKEISECYAHADDCARKAAEASSEELRDDFLRLQRSWLNLAHSYEFTERLTAFTRENERNRSILQKAIDSVFDKGADKIATPGSRSRKMH